MSRFLLAVLLLGSLIRIIGQQPLVGIVEGKTAPYAALTATNIDSVEPENYRRTTVADRQGIYDFVDVPEGRYSIVVRKQGYRDSRIPEVTVRPGETVDLPKIKMTAAASR